MIIATAGHVDHGKTLLVKALTGTNTDKLPEEKKRGLTIDIGFAYLPIPNDISIGIVDVPGHKRFIRNMLCGITGIDFILFIVAADDGPMPQTEEHLQILDLLEKTEGALVITKIDRASPKRIRKTENDFRALSSKTSLKNIPSFLVSSLTGEGINDVKDYLIAKSKLVSSHRDNGNFRMPIDRKFSLPGAGLIVTGTSFSGQVKLNEKLLVLPNNINVKIRGIHAQNRESQVGCSGQRLALNLVGADINRHSIKRGCWLVSDVLPTPIKKIDARLKVISTKNKPLAHWTPVHFHFGSSKTIGRIAILETKTIDPGNEALVQIVLEQPIAALYGDRFIVRNQSASNTIGGGKVIDIFPQKTGRANRNRIQFLTEMEKTDDRAALIGLLNISNEGLPLENFVTARNLKVKSANKLFANIDCRQIVTEKGTLGFNKKHWNALLSTMLKALEDWHRKFPDHTGLNDNQLLAAANLNLPREVGVAIAKDLSAFHSVKRQGNLIYMANHKPTFSEQDDKLWNKIKLHVELQSPRLLSVHEIGFALKIKPSQVESLMVRAARNKLVKRISKTRFILPEALASLARLAEAIANENINRDLEVKIFRDKSKIGRNMTIEILEYFDKIKYTRRVGRVRKLLKGANQTINSDSST
ncbi:MAG: selenocysteine-specific translation elongation factor [Rhodospirillaceae bacterium]|nr:selenocysteine-specific translation elongation factor [Rhodospirillaceae bacterium]|tara:strand:- start:54 stop:1988 length:1935 start_codon:yes stop_codon:yes gene_type:complete